MSYGKAVLLVEDDLDFAENLFAGPSAAGAGSATTVARAAQPPVAPPYSMGFVM